MTYERYKTGTFRVCVFLTILLEVLAFAGNDTMGLRDTVFRFDMNTIIFGIVFEEMAAVVWNTPILIWGTYFFSLWIYKGFTNDKKKDETNE